MYVDASVIWNDIVSKIDVKSVCWIIFKVAVMPDFHVDALNLLSFTETWF